MLPTLESLANAPPAETGSRPVGPAAWAVGLGGAVVVAIVYVLAFPIEYRHPIDVIDAVREQANFLGALAIAIWMRRDVPVLNAGTSTLLISLWMEVVDEFTAEPHWIGTIVPAILGTTGIALIAFGVREAARRRVAEAERRTMAEDALRKSLTTLAAVVEGTPDAIWIKGADGRYMLANSAFASLVGHSASSIVGRSEADLFAERPDVPGRAIARALESGAEERFEATVNGAGGQPMTFLVSRGVFRDGTRAVGVLGIARDISERKATEERLMRQAHHDALTGLANRASFMDHLRRALGRWHHRPDRLFAVLFIDIDNFKDVNDRFGHGVGDEALVAFADALHKWLRPGDFIARLGGDEFTVVLHDVAGMQDAETVVTRINKGLLKPFRLSAGPVSLSVSTGAALSSTENSSPEGILHAADAAMYRAKGGGGAVTSRS